MYDAKYLQKFETSELKKICEDHDYDRVIMIYYKETPNDPDMDYEYGVSTYSKDLKDKDVTIDMGVNLAKCVPVLISKEKDKAAIKISNAKENEKYGKLQL